MGTPFLANLFMSSFEVELSKLDWFPRIWHRYVDDVFAVVNKNRIDDTYTHNVIQLNYIH